MAQCKGKSRASGERCKRPANKGRDYCHKHGGKVPVGIAHPNFKHGQVSRYMPERLMQRYNEALEDPELLSVRKDLAMLEARKDDLLQRVDVNEAGETWRNLQEQVKLYSRAQRSRDEIGAREAWIEIQELTEKGANDYLAWDELLKVSEQSRKLSETERKRLVEMQNMVSSEKALAYARALAEIVQRQVRDPETLRRIADEMAVLNTRSY